MRIVLDTNGIVSALLAGGSVPDQVLETVIAGTTRLVVDGRVLREYREVLGRPGFGFPSDPVAELLALIERSSEWVVALPLPLNIPDPADLPFLESAVAAGADALVTGNPRHFRVREGRLAVPVLTPRQLLDRLASRG